MRNPMTGLAMRVNPFRGFRSIVYKEVLHIRRDFMTVFFAMFIPTLQMIVLGFGIDTNIRQVNTVVFDENGKKESRELIDRLRNSDTFRVREFVQSDAALNDAIVGGRAKVGIKIPYDYSRQLMDRSTAQVLVLIDGSDSSVAGQAINVATSIGFEESLRRALPPRYAIPVEVRPKLLFNPDSRSPNFFLPGLVAVLLLFFTAFLTALAIVREKERGTLEQLFVTPVRPLGLLLGKLVPYFVIGIMGLSALLFFMRTVFQVPIAGHVLLLYALATPYLFVNLSIGLLISSRANTQPEAMQMSMMVILPTIFFSGYIFPRETMPLPFYILSFFVPGTYFVNISRGIILRGAGIAHLWTDGLVLLCMGVLLLLAAAKRFQKKVIAA
jgi:ABC-2 type transport system permease protein